MIELKERRTVTRPRLLRTLADIQAAGWCQRTLYLTPATLRSRLAQQASLPPEAWQEPVHLVLRDSGESDTGLALFLGGDQAIAVAPPFPITADAESEGADTAPLSRMLHQDVTVGVVLLRLGRYAVGVVQGDRLIASKTGSRYVKGRHRAGGQSQRRFERGREKLVRELYDKACEIAQGVFTPLEQSIDYVLLGGEAHTLRGFLERCRYLQGLRPRTLERRLNVDRPGQEALEKLGSEVWKGRILTFSPVE